MKTKKGITLLELIVILVILILVLIVIAPFAIPLLGLKGIEYSEGQRTGLNYKISKKGFVWSTYEGELSLQLTTRNSEGGIVNQVFNYSVSDPAIAKEIETMSSRGKPITLTYKQYKFRGYCYGDTEYDIVGVTGSN